MPNELAVIQKFSASNKLDALYSFMLFYIDEHLDFQDTFNEYKYVKILHEESETTSELTDLMNNPYPILITHSIKEKSNSVNYKSKYIKYKTKYISLRKY